MPHLHGDVLNPAARCSSSLLVDFVDRERKYKHRIPWFQPTISQQPDKFYPMSSTQVNDLIYKNVKRESIVPCDLQQSIVNPLFVVKMQTINALESGFIVLYARGILTRCSMLGV